MKKKVVKILNVIFIAIFIISLTQNVFAVGSSDITTQFDGVAENVSVGEIQSILGIVLTVVRTVAVGISIIMITYLGIKYMSAAPSEKANIKNQLITFTIGAVIVIGAVTIIGVVKNFAQDNIT